MCYSVEWEGYDPREATWEYRPNVVHPYASSAEVAQMVRDVDSAHRTRVNAEVATWSSAHLAPLSEQCGDSEVPSTDEMREVDEVYSRWVTSHVPSSVAEDVGERRGDQTEAGASSHPDDGAIPKGRRTRRTQRVSDAFISGFKRDFPPLKVDCASTTAQSKATLPTPSFVGILVSDRRSDSVMKTPNHEKLESSKSTVHVGVEYGDECDGSSSGEDAGTTHEPTSTTSASSFAKRVALKSPPTMQPNGHTPSSFEWVPLGESGSFVNPVQQKVNLTLAEVALAPSVSYQNTTKGMNLDQQRRNTAVTELLGEDYIREFGVRAEVPYDDSRAILRTQLFGVPPHEFKRIMSVSERHNNWVQWGISSMAAMVTSRVAMPLVDARHNRLTAASTKIEIVALVPGEEILEARRCGGNPYTAPLPLCNTVGEGAARRESGDSLMVAEAMCSLGDEVNEAEMRNERWVDRLGRDRHLLSEVVSETREEDAVVERVLRRHLPIGDPHSHNSSADPNPVAIVSQQAVTHGESSSALDDAPKSLRLRGRKSTRAEDGTNPDSVNQARGQLLPAHAEMASNINVDAAPIVPTSGPHMRPFWDRMYLEDGFSDPLSGATDVLFYSRPSDELLRMSLGVFRVVCEQELIDFLLERATLIA